MSNRKHVSSINLSQEDWDLLDLQVEAEINSSRSAIISRLIQTHIKPKKTSLLDTLKEQRLQASQAVATAALLIAGKGLW